jgi:hypothetical protein
MLAWVDFGRPKERSRTPKKNKKLLTHQLLVNQHISMSNFGHEQVLDVVEDIAAVYSKAEAPLRHPECKQLLGLANLLL